ncbi:MAG: proline dehydrogenase family protein [Pseudomonadota bacterium]|nr:proline dehydrogenase family protein [Pseudomonadota bacterium]
MQVADVIADLEARIQSLGQRLFEQAGREVKQAGNGWLDALIDRAIQDREFRVQTLRFVDVLPTLQDDAALVAHLKEYFADTALPWPAVSHWSLRHSDAPWAIPIAASLVRATLRGLSRRFMGGSTLSHAVETITRLRNLGMSYSLDLLGEAVISEGEADAYQQAYLDLLAGLQKDDDSADRPDVSLKLTSLSSRINPADPNGSVAAINARLRPILTEACAQNAAVTFDMEHYDVRQIVLQCFMELLMEPEFRDWAYAGIAVQAYLRDAPESLQTLIDWVDVRGTPIKVRLVRGAYWDTETVIAHQHGWALPVWAHKGQTDACYETCLERLFASHSVVIPAVATHNVRSLACAMALAERYGLSAGDYELQMLYGMADDLKQSLVALGYPLRVYVPYGETLPGMAYLVRRLLENTSGQTILDSGMGKVEREAQSLARPVSHVPVHEQPVAAAFRNQSVRRFVATEERTAFRDAIMAVRSELGHDYAPVINNEAVAGSGQIISINPAHPDEIIGMVASAGREQADRALVAARVAYPNWRALPTEQRAGLLRKIAALLIEQRDRFAAWQVLEAGKHWCEADADVCEAVDFLNYYARQAEQLAMGEVTELNGEHNAVYLRPRGIGLVIAPWNFPLAILTGMLSAMIVTGNTAILKPSSLTPVIAARFMELVVQAGIPPGVVNFLPGPGCETGAYLAAHPEVAIIAFTGSRDVGAQLIQTGAQVMPGQMHIKRVIAELGGKNAIIIDDDADLDAAIPGVVQSAFGFQGQKCSAASRVIVVGNIYAAFIKRLAEATASLTTGDPQQPGNLLGPVIDAASKQRIAAVIEKGRTMARLLTPAHDDLPDAGYYMAPVVFTDVAPDDPLAQEEIFGPVLAVLRVDTFERAIDLANNTQYALTGGVYSRRPVHLERAREAFQVGNLYLNRKITGALVSRQPFGGFRLSGMGSKTGGPDYLKQFTDPVCITENTLRRGFAPEVKDV